MDGGYDPTIAVDLRAVNGSNGTKFEVFWKNLEKVVEDALAPVTQDNRHSEVQHASELISMPTLVREAAKLEPSEPFPSVKRVEMQFAPSNKYNKTAQRYTGKFKIKRKIQARTLRKKNIDLRYTRALNDYIKSFLRELGEDGAFIFVTWDDKSKVSLGDPEAPISTGVRAHTQVLQAGAALDHS
jgi:hypothetical protein